MSDEKTNYRSTRFAVSIASAFFVFCLNLYAGSERSSWQDVLVAICIFTVIFLWSSVHRLGIKEKINNTPSAPLFQHEWLELVLPFAFLAILLLMVHH
ncbi:hypothetical protein [Deinococcus roseus]|uniref:hypothetical protein n=1 Tax=Deinococcus roseus TaxID=392414 RepID=UPI001665D113|nr:hypothetical protein [Deinococcus roseus]